MITSTGVLYPYSACPRIVGKLIVLFTLAAIGGWYFSRGKAHVVNRGKREPLAFSLQPEEAAARNRRGRASTGSADFDRLLV
jgi:hypothetical protein